MGNSYAVCCNAAYTLKTRGGKRGTDMADTKKARIWYAASFIIIFILEILIALYVDDLFIRPYGGDILVTALLCCGVRIFIPRGVRTLPIWVFLFAAAVEVGQYFNFVDLIGLGNIEFFRILMGTSFSFIDIICYAAGCALFFICESLCRLVSGNNKK